MVKILATLAALIRFIYQDHTNVANVTKLYISWRTLGKNLIKCSQCGKYFIHFFMKIIYLNLNNSESPDILSIPNVANVTKLYISWCTLGKNLINAANVASILSISSWKLEAFQKLNSQCFFFNFQIFYTKILKLHIII